MNAETASERRSGQRIVLALGGNAISPAGQGGTAAEQIANISATMRSVAELIVTGGYEVVLTHGNGPQVGNLLLKNEIARDEVPPMPLDWCVAQTQATIGYVTITALEQELGKRGNYDTVVPVISRIRVAADDPAWQRPTKPIGPYASAEEAEALAEDRGHEYREQGDRGWRRVVPSPEPVEILEPMTIALLLEAGAIVVANGGGGIPMVRDEDGILRGAEAVVDKDLAGNLLAQTVDADRFAILTDVRGVAVGFGTDDERWLEEVTVAELRELQDAGNFAEGSMGPKVEAVCRFAEQTGRPAVIAALDDVTGAAEGRSGTRVTP
ncbi:MAG: carbamate kinase [Egibacteraceae bacterium]